MAVSINFVMDQGTFFEGIANIQNNDGSAYDLTDMLVYCQMRRSYYTKTAINIHAEVYGDPLNGKIRLWLNPSETDPIKPVRYVYDVEVHSTVDPNKVKRVLQGVITVSPQSTKIPAMMTLEATDGANIVIDSLENVVV